MTAFPSHAADFNTIGLCPLPVIDKRPCVFGFNGWQGLSANTIKRFSERFPDADIAILTGLSGLAVVDIDTDDPSFITEVHSEFGFTPITVKTKKGWHFYYLNPAGVRGAVHPTIPIDIKAAGPADYVVAPPTDGYDFHLRSLDGIPEGTDDIFAFLSILQTGLPAIKIDAVQYFFPDHLPVKALLQVPDTYFVSNDNEEENEVIKFPNLNTSFEQFNELHSEIPQGTRNDILFKWGMWKSAILVKEHGENANTLTSLHQKILEKNNQCCEPPLSEKEIEKITDSIWYNYQLKDRNYYCKRHEFYMTHITMTPKGILENLNNSNRFSLLLWLKSLYNEGDEFILNAPALAGLIQPSKGTIDAMKKYLLENEFIKKVSESDRNKGISAKFVFTDKSNEYVTRILPHSHSNDNDSSSITDSRSCQTPSLTG